MIEYKIDLFFNRQLRIKRENKSYANALIKSNQIIGYGFINFWRRSLEFNLSPKQIKSIYDLAIENFFLQINSKNLNYAWLSKYFKELNKIAKTLYACV